MAENELPESVLRPTGPLLDFDAAWWDMVERDGEPRTPYEAFVAGWNAHRQRSGSVERAIGALDGYELKMSPEEAVRRVRDRE